MNISALIPTYNRQAQVLRAIDSILAQTVPVDEIIVVDDGSTDGSAEAIRSRYGSRVTVIQQGNAGVSAARNRGIREARGAWIAFLDSDDVWLPTKIQRQIEALAAKDDNFGLCFTDCIYEGDPDKKLSVFQETGLGKAPTFSSLEEPAMYILTSREPFWTQSLLVRRSLLESLGGFDEALTIREDTDVLFRLSFRTQFCFVAEALVRIDRTPSRVGLCNLYFADDDRAYDCLERLYSKWLAMPEVQGKQYEQPIRDLLRETLYASAEAKLHRAKIGRAFREINSLRGIDGSYMSVATTLFTRKMAKLLRKQGVRSIA